MPLYRYRAISDSGKISRGKTNALNEQDLAAQLEKTGLELIRAQKIKNRASLGKLARRDLIELLFQLAMLLRAGVPILSILADLRDTTEVLKIRNLCTSLHERIDSGSTLSQALSATPGIFPELVINLIRAGEATGQLPDVLDEIVESLKWQDELLAKTRQILVYPAFVALVVGMVVIFLMTYLVPQIVGFVANMGGTIPLQTRLLISISNAFVRYGWIIVPAPFFVFMLLALLAKSSQQARRMLHAAELNLPYIGSIIKKIMLARASDTLGLTYRTGIPVLDGLVYCSNVTGNLVLKEAIEHARTAIANGASISRGFADQKLFPALIIRMIKTGEETGDLTGALKNISYFYNRDINESIARMQSLIEPSLTILLGIMLGWIMTAVLGPIYDTVSRIRLT